MYKLCYNIHRSLLRFVYKIINNKSGAYSAKRADANCRVISVFHDAEREQKRPHRHACSCTCTLGGQGLAKGPHRAS